MAKPVCVVVGVGPGNGAAFATRYSKEGYTVALLARKKDFTQQLATELANCHPYDCDVSNTQSVEKVFQQIQKDLGDISVVVYNAGSGSWGNVEEITSELFETSWRVNTLGLLAVSQAVIPSMKKKGKGSIIVIGATASRRGGINTAAFAPAKAAQRSLAESMAKHLWPQGIHVALVIIDGTVDLPKTREWMSDKPASYFVKPVDVANTVFWLSHQPSSAWSFEVEARPFAEHW
ncbi:putative oxidoreductase [Legionella massiliensis]|uniref:Putative oxidoreductase n=1 Tax=Legionella massiliensis TaxID=1034943 RepID=A0A078L0Q1_9GAMM|nr:SDR family NAD(P)-dependent oxidoreductase [Legionella massiliensis]CDZ78822.1 putative oxidoreductase [Legionella massiliensis]CEE14560.1 putative oxidoreductase [Legionella massiliensis]